MQRTRHMGDEGTAVATTTKQAGGTGRAAAVPGDGTPPSPTRTGRRCLAIRKAKGWTQQELADALGVARASVANWETGRIKAMKVYRLAVKALADEVGVGDVQ